MQLPTTHTMPRPRLCFVLLFFAFALTFNMGCSDDTESGAEDLSDTDALADFADDTSASDTATPSDTDADEDSPDQGEPCGAALRATWSPAELTTRELVSAGIYANAIAIEGGMAFVVNSGDNAVQRYAVSDPGGTNTPSFVDVGADKNPYDLAVYGERLYITNSMEGSITVADADGTVLSTALLPELVGPQDIVATEDYLFVANTEFTWPAPEGRFGSLVVLSRSDTPSVLNRIETTQSNPQFLALGEDTLYVINSGATAYDMETYIVTPVSDGGVDSFPLADIETAGAPSANIVLSPQELVGNPGRPALVNDTLYLGSGTSAVLFAVDVASKTVIRGADNPIALGDDLSQNGLVAPFAGPGGLLYVLDFNMDTLELLDPACDTWVGQTIPLGTNDELLEGPLSLAWSADGVAHIVMSVSSAITTVDTKGLLQ